MSQENNDELIDQLKKDIELWEGQEIEFMKDYPDTAHELSKEIAAFATSNAGTIYLGVENNKNIVGLSAIIDFGEAKGKDSILDRLAGLTQRAIKPPIIVTTHFINIENKNVLKINVPKGVEPVYFSKDIPYIRNLTASDRATPDQVKELHRQYFLGQGSSEEINGKQEFLDNVLFQLSDVQILSSDYINRIVNPDLDQMRYDISATGRRLLELSMESRADELGLSVYIQSLGDILEELEHHEFYEKGEVSWRDFNNKWDKATELTNRLLQRVLKNYQLKEDQIDIIKENISRNVKELKNCWRKKEQYLMNGELALLKDTLRRLAYNFNRFGNMPEQFEVFAFSTELKQLAKNLREISSDKYLRQYAVGNPLEKIKEKMEKNLQISEAILVKIEQ